MPGLHFPAAPSTHCEGRVFSKKHPEHLTRAVEPVRMDPERFAAFFRRKLHSTAIHFDGHSAEEALRHDPRYMPLRGYFAERMDHNNVCIGVSDINIHNKQHQCSVAQCAVQIGRRLTMTAARVQELLLAGAFHDVGYIYPSSYREEVAAGRMDSQLHGKTAQDDHPTIGATAYVLAVERFLQQSDHPDLQARWDAFGRDLSYNAIRYHSNGSAYQPDSVPIEEKLLRMSDKLDNTYWRVYAWHMEAARMRAEGHSTDETYRQTRDAQTMTVADARPHGTSLENVMGALTAIDPHPCHRLVPYSIVDQYLEMTTQGEFQMHYAVDLHRVSRKLGVQYTKSAFLKDFADAYGRSSMPRSAEVAYSVRAKIAGMHIAPTEPSLAVVFDFGHNDTHVLSYAPRFN